MNSLLRIWSILTVTARRLSAQRGLALATLLGLAAAMALAMSIPLYADGVYYRVLSEGLFSDAPRYRGKALRPPVALLFRYVGSFSGPLQWESIQPLDRYLSAEGVYRDLKLPPSPDVPGARMFNTGLLGLFKALDAEAVTQKPPLLDISLICTGAPETHLQIVEGRLPEVNVQHAPRTTNNTNNTNNTQHATSDTSQYKASFEVLFSRALADKMGTHVGEVYIAYDTRAMRKYKEPAKFQLRVAGVWEPADPHAEFWEHMLVPLDNLLFVSESTFAGQISPALTDEVYQAMWYLPMDASQIFSSDVAPLLTRVQRLQRRVEDLLPNTTLDISPVKALTRYQKEANRLTVLLLAFSVPIFSLLLAFVILVAALTVEQQHNQIATLRSRGATVPQVVGTAALEGTLLGVLALAIALPASLLLAYAIGQTRSFLDFALGADKMRATEVATTGLKLGDALHRTDVDGLRVGLGGYSTLWATARFGIAAMALTLAMQVGPMLSLARHTIVTYKGERARTLRPPWWQRAWLDLLLLFPAGYGTYVLSQQGSILQDAADIPTDPFQDPLLFLVPALSLSALALAILRLLPLLTRALAWLGAYTRSTSLVLAVRQLSRAPGHYAAPLGLLILTLSLSTYTASLAATLDEALYDQQYYWVGADASLIDLGDNPQAQGGSFSTGGDQGAGSQDPAYWRFPPVSDYLKVPGVQAATRIGRYQARIQAGEHFQAGTFIGVERTDLARVAFWRSDFASEPLGALMNRLALVNDGVLLPRDWMRAHALDVGDRVNVTIIAYDQTVSFSGPSALQIVGAFDLFPTWYPESGPLLVGNLETFFDQAHMQLPYRVWFKTAPGVDYDQLSDEAWQISLGAQGVLAAYERIRDEQRRPERQGLLGLLSVGFGAAAVLTALGFMLYALFSFHRRSVELGVLRAMGMSTWQMSLLVACELGFLLLIGGTAGTGLGVWASRTFIPYLQIGAQAQARVPPFVVEIAWPALLRVYALFGLLFFVALAVLIRLLQRLKLFQAIKLGETL